MVSVMRSISMVMSAATSRAKSAMLPSPTLKQPWNGSFASWRGRSLSRLKNAKAGGLDDWTSWTTAFHLPLQRNTRVDRGKGLVHLGRHGRSSMLRLSNDGSAYDRFPGRLYLRSWRKNLEGTDWITCTHKFHEYDGVPFGIEAQQQYSPPWSGEPALPKSMDIARRRDILSRTILSPRRFS